MEVAQCPTPLDAGLERDQEEQRRADQHDDVHRRLDPLEYAEDFGLADLQLDRERDVDEPGNAGDDRRHDRRPQRHVGRGDRLRLALRRLGDCDQLAADLGQPRSGKALADALLEPAQRLDDLRRVEGPV